MRTLVVLLSIALVAACRAGGGVGAPPGAPPPSSPPVSVTPTLLPGGTALPTVATTTIPAVVPPMTDAPAATAAPATTDPPATTDAPATGTSASAAAATGGLLDGISMTAVPPDVIVPTTDESVAKATNPINGRRGGRRPAPGAADCVVDPADPTPCLTHTLDLLGFDVTSGSAGDAERRVERATAVVQLDAGRPVTGVADVALDAYLAITPDATWATGADEVRRLGTSAQGRPITGLRFGDGARVVLVVGQTHGDEEGGLRVLLRARTLPVPEGVTLWVIPTMNPDGLVLDTRFLADGNDPNRRAPSEPEQQAVHDFALAVRPELTVWYHQNYGWVGGSGASMAPARQYQALTRLGTLKHSGDCGVGFMWCPIDGALGSSSILVELPDVLTPADVQVHARALLAVAAGP